MVKFNSFNRVYLVPNCPLFRPLVCCQPDVVTRHHSAANEVPVWDPKTRSLLKVLLITLKHKLVDITCKGFYQRMFSLEEIFGIPFC